MVTEALMQQWLQCRHQTAHVDGLPDAASGTQADGIDCCARSYGHDDDWYVGAARLVVTCFHKGATSHVGNVQPHQDGIGYGPSQVRQRRVAISHDIYDTVEILQYRGRRLAAGRIVVNQQNALHVGTSCCATRHMMRAASQTAGWTNNTPAGGLSRYLRG